MKTILEYPGIHQVSIKISCIYNFASSCASPTVTDGNGGSWRLCGLLQLAIEATTLFSSEAWEKNAGCIKGGAPYQLLLG